MSREYPSLFDDVWMRPARALDLGLEVRPGWWDRVTVQTWPGWVICRAGWAGRFVVETVLAFRLATPETAARRLAADARGEVLPADMTEHSRPVPWLPLGDGVDLLRCRVVEGELVRRSSPTPDGREVIHWELRAERPGLTWTWQGGRILLEGVESTKGQGEVQRMIPGLPLLRRFIGGGRPRLEESQSSGWREVAAKGEALKRQHPGLTWDQAAGRLGVHPDTLRKYRRRARVS